MIHEIPQGWISIYISEIAHEVRARHAGVGKIQILSMTKYDGFIDSLEYFKKQVFSKNTEKYKLVKRGQFAYATIHLDEGSIDLLDKFEAGLISPMYTVFEPDVDKVDNLFLRYLLKSERMIKIYGRLGQGSINRRKSIGFKILGSIEIVLPPLPEQKKIVAILSSVDDAIQATQAVIDQISKVKQGMLQQLLTHGIGHTRFKQTEIGKIPEDWGIVCLSEIFEKLQAGVSVNSEDRLREEGEFGILKTSCVYGGFFDPLKHKTILKHEISRASISPLVDHIIISRMNTPALVGASGYVDRDYPDIYLPDRLWQANVKDCTKTSARWLSYVLMSPSMRKVLSEKASGTSGSMKNLSKTSVLSIQIALPPINEQLKIISILCSIDSSIDYCKEELKGLIFCKKGLMQDLLTGRVRVKLDEMNTT